MNDHSHEEHLGREGKRRQTLQFVSRNGQRINYDPFFDADGDYDSQVPARSGSGKSMVTSPLIVPGKRHEYPQAS